jgi:hypothetical protein
MIARDLVLSLPPTTVPLIFLDRIPEAEWRGRALLLISSGSSVTRALGARIATRSSALAFLPERVIIGGDASDWIIHDILVGDRSQIRVASGDGDDAPGIPGEVFGQEIVDDIIEFETVQTAMSLTFVVSYVGASDSGAPFCCAVLGVAV